MADQDFLITIRTTADTAGIARTEAELKRLGVQVESVRKAAAAPGGGAGTAGFAGSAVGVGTIIGLVTGAINKWQQFNDELDKQVEKMIQVEQKMRALGESIIDIQDNMISVRRIGAEPLEQSFARLTHEIIRLKTEQSLLDLPTQGDEWKKLNSDISKNEALLRGVTSATDQQAKEAEKLAAAKEKAFEKERGEAKSFVKGAFETTGPQVQRALQQEEAARKAEAAGDTRSADLFRKSSEAFQRGMTQPQREEFSQLKAAIDRLGEKFDRYWGN